MAINIKNPGVEAKLKQVAKLRGENLTRTVERLAEEDLARLGVTIKIEALDALLSRTAVMMKDGPRWQDIDDLLYDDKGLPK